MFEYKMTKQGVRDLSGTRRHSGARVLIPDNRTASPQVFKLFVSYNLGLSYDCHGQGTEEELEPLMLVYEKKMLRWYTEAVDGEKQVTHISGTHQKILALLKTLEIISTDTSL